MYLVFARLNPSCITGVQWEKSGDYTDQLIYFQVCFISFTCCLIPFDYIPDHREQLKLPRLVINNHKSFIRVVEISATKTTLVEGNQDFVFLEKTSDKVRYSTLKLQELNAKMKALQEENEQIQRALSEDLCNQVNKIQCSPNNSAELKQRERRRPGCHGQQPEVQCLP